MSTPISASAEAVAYIGMYLPRLFLHRFLPMSQPTTIRDAVTATGNACTQQGHVISIHYRSPELNQAVLLAKAFLGSLLLP